MVNLTGPQGDKEDLMIKATKEMGMVMENPMGMVAQVLMVIQMEVDVQVKMESHPGGEEPPGRNGESGEGDGNQTPVMMMGVGMGPPLPHQILHHLEERGIGGPDSLCGTGTSRTTRSDGTAWTSW